MTRLFLATLFACAACQPSAAPTSTLPSSPWCQGTGEHAGETMPPKEAYAGQLPPGPQSEEFVALLVRSPVDPGKLWAVYVDDGRVVAWQDVDEQDLHAYATVTLASTWRLNWVPRVGTTPPPPPPNGGDDVYVPYFTGMAALFLAAPELARARAGL